MTNHFDTPEYKRSRKAYAAHCTFEYFVAILAGDVFLAKLLLHAGMADWLIGIVSSIISLACLFQLFSVLIASKLKNIKKMCLIFVPLNQLLFMSMFVVPFLPIPSILKPIIITVMLFSAYFFYHLVASLLFKWANSFVDPKKRGQFSATKEMISLACGIVFTLIVGYIMDSFEALNNLEGGFLFLAISIFICAASCFVCIFLVKKRADHIAEEPNAKSAPLKVVLKNTLGNKNYRNVVIMSSMMHVSRYLTLGFMGTFKTKDLLLSVTIVQVINMVANFMRLVFSKPFGRYSDKHSFASAITLGLTIAAVGFAANMFTTPSWIWGIVIFTICYNVSLAGINQNESNIIYNYVETEYFSQALAIKTSISGVLGFGASLVGSFILSFVQNNSNTFLGIPMYGQQLLSALSLLMTIATIVFLKLVIEKQAKVTR